MENHLDIKVPQETVNDDFVKIINWFVKFGDYVNKGDDIVEIETSKATLIIEADDNGFIEVFFENDSEVKIGQVIGRISLNPSIVNAKSGKNFEPLVTTSNSLDNSEKITKINTTYSNKAKALIEKHSIDINVFFEQEFVREVDVTNYLQRLTMAPIKHLSEDKEEKINNDNKIKQRDNYNNERNSIWTEAIKSSKDRGKSVVWLILNYIFRNWLLNGLVRWSPYGVIIWVHKLRGVKIGKGCFIDPTSIIETAHPEYITIGHDVRIAAHAVIMTHIKAPNHLRDLGFVPLTLKSVELQNHCFIGVNATILPGVTIGEGSVVASGAVVTSSVKPYCLVSGNPAKVVKVFSKNLSNIPNSK